MSEYKVANRYAKALVDLLQQNNTLDAGFKDMREFHALLLKTDPLMNLLKSPIIHGHQKMAVLQAIFGKSFLKVTMDFFALIIEKKREYYLQTIAEVFIEQYQLIKNIGTATVKSAIALDANTNDAIRKFIESFTGKQIEVTSVVDPKIIGGIIIHSDNKLYDASITGSLYKAKQELLNTYISK
ncbi:MAG: ATP synthase F1 subunit delta [Bacteroidia bacterium]|jgi:F-type H+-transporting ATPase subunit delta